MANRAISCVLPWGCNVVGGCWTKLWAKSRSEGARSEYCGSIVASSSGVLVEGVEELLCVSRLGDTCKLEKESSSEGSLSCVELK